MKRACSFLRPSSHYGAESFVCGFRALGYTMTADVYALGEGDFFLTWNRHSTVEMYALEAERRGATVIVAENGYFGRTWRGETWFALALGQHNGAGKWPRDDGRRWRAIGFELQPWREGGDEVVLLPQRGIGAPGVAMPMGWAEKTQARIGGRIRQHPGRNADDTLGADLERARAVVTWGSGAAIKAIAMGIPCYHQFPKWIGAPASVELTHDALCEVKFIGDRAPMFDRLACAMWRVGEIESGYAINELLSIRYVT